MQKGSYHQLLNRKFPRQCSHNNVAVLGFDGAVDNQHVAILNARINHGVAAHLNEIGRARVAHQQIIQVKALLNIVLSGGGKPAGNAINEQRQL